MGGGAYSTGNDGVFNGSIRYTRATKAGYYTLPPDQIFKKRTISNMMNPAGITIRESRDSEEHPKSVAIVIALDVTGSMGSVPHHLVKDGLPDIMGKIIQAGCKDPQTLFLAIGDHTCDRAPLQVGQFESSDELLDKWLTDVYIEGNGGGNEGESYLLAWYFAARHTSIDCLEKGRTKGFLFTIGDEPVLKNISGEALKEIMGGGQYDQYVTAAQLLDEARKKYHVFHVHIRETYAGSRENTMNDWKQLLGDHLIIAQSHDQISTLIPEAIIKVLSKGNVIDITTKDGPKESIPNAKDENLQNIL